MLANKRYSVYIIADLEGIAGLGELGINSKENNLTTMAYHKLIQARSLLTAEVNAAVLGILDASSNVRIVVYDSHGYGDSILPNELNINAELIMGKKHHEPLPKLDPSFDAIILIGAHSKAGSHGCMNHTFSRHVKKMILNDSEVGEIGIYSYLAAEKNIPLIFISGDNVAVAEAKKYCCDISCVTTKESLSVKSVISLSPKQVCNDIRKMVYDAINHIDIYKTLPMKAPYILQVKYKKPFFTYLRAIKHRKPRDLFKSSLFSTYYNGNSLDDTVRMYLND